MQVLKLLAFIFLFTFCISYQASAQHYWKHYDNFRLNLFMMNACAAKDSLHFIAGGLDLNDSYLFKTDDGGKSWTKIFSDYVKIDKSKNPPYIMMNLFIRDAAYLPNGVMIVVADSNIQITKKEGATTTYYQQETGVILRSADEGKTWAATTFGALSDTNARRTMNISMSDSLNGIVSQWRADSKGAKVSPLIYTADGGLTWRDSPSPDNNNTIPQCISSPVAGVWIVCGYSYTEQQRVIWRTEDFGKTWIIVKNLPPINEFTFISSLIGYSAGQTGTDANITDVISKTTDGGLTWKPLFNKIQPPIASPLQDISFADEMNGVAVGHGGKILHTFDGGITWRPEESGLESYAVEHLFKVVCPTPRHAVGVGLNGKMMRYVPEGILEQPRWITPTPAGVDYSTNVLDRPVRLEWSNVPGAEKYQLQLGKTNYFGNDPGIKQPLYLDSLLLTNTPVLNNLKAEIGFLIRVRAIAESDTSNWSKPTSFSTSSKPVSVENSNSIISYIEPYPNPANGVVYIPFKTTNESEISTTISDALGKSINTFKSSYSLSHNAIILSDLELLPNGIYFVQISQGNQQQTSMITILR